MFSVGQVGFAHARPIVLSILLVIIHSSLHVIIIPLTQDGITPLYVASQNGHSDVVNILIRNGADINLAHNVWRYNVPYTHTVYNCRRFSHKAYRSLNVHVCSTLWLVSHGYYGRNYMYMQT